MFTDHGEAMDETEEIPNENETLFDIEDGENLMGLIGTYL